MAAFTVDTKLFQELGELLVAKEATALTELVKNAYDADATVVRVHGTDLKNAGTGAIVVTDDGAGMSAEEFERGFLRIAGRTKSTADRKSPAFGRRFTGEKGVGRLAAHKLAKRLAVRSFKAGEARRGARKLLDAVTGLEASIDWDAIEELETLDEVAGSSAVLVKKVRVTRGQRSGTSLFMAPLRRAWTVRMIENFLKEAVTLTPVPMHWDSLPKGLATEKLLFDKVPVRDQANSDPGFRIEFSGDLAFHDVLTPEVAESASWIAEIEFDRETGLLKMAVSPTSTLIRAFPTSEGFQFKHKLKAGAGPTFRARILQRSEKTWNQALQGVRIFMEGFRVPPYGDATDDWLGLDRDYRNRAHRSLSSLSGPGMEEFPTGLPKEELALQSNAAYSGAVYLHRSSTPGMEMLVNREGFLPGPGLDFITEWVRVAMDLIVRVGYASRYEQKAEAKKDRARQKEAAQKADAGESPAALRVRESAMAAAKNLEVVRTAIRTGDLKKAAAAAKEAIPHIEDVRMLSDEFGSEAVMWRVLASLGTELAAFVHEINALALEAGAIVNDLEEAIPLITSRSAAAKVRAASKAALALAERVRRNATYLVDSTSFKGRRRRSRLPLRERFESVEPFFRSRIEERGIELLNEIPGDVRSPPMFPAELAGIFTNLLSNAVKFTEDGGKVRVSASIDDGVMAVTMENSGTCVDLTKAERLFQPFISTTEKPDAVLGQGMGMGLTITRAFVQEYGGTIEFVAPSKGFATALRFEVPAR